MNFIFPKNYNFSFKLFGFINYTSIVINLIYGFILYFFISFLFKSFIVKLYIFIALFLPVFLFISLNRSDENILIIFKYILKYIFRPKVYFYDKRY